MLAIIKNKGSSTIIMGVCKLIIFFLIVFLSGCSSAITRYNYNMQYSSGKEKSSNFMIPIKQNFNYNKDEVEILGSILAGDTGVSFQCGESYVLSIFQQEAYALGADLINITYERKMDIWSSCYRAKAEFLRFKNRDVVKTLKSDVEYVR